MKKIVVKFDLTTGSAYVEAVGFQGNSCGEATQFLQNLGEVSEFKKKSEWYNINTELQRQEQKITCD